MRTELPAVCLALIVLTSAASAAPIQAIAQVGSEQSGNVSVSGFTGEIYVALYAPHEKLRYSNFLLGCATCDNFVEGQLNHLNLGGIHEPVDMGDVLWPGQPPSYYADARIVYQTGFVSPLIYLSPTFVRPGFQPPPGVEGFWVTTIPEPATLGLLAVSLLSLALRRRTRSVLYMPVTGVVDLA